MERWSCPWFLRYFWCFQRVQVCAFWRHWICRRIRCTFAWVPFCWVYLVKLRVLRVLAVQCTQIHSRLLSLQFLWRGWKFYLGWVHSTARRSRFRSRMGIRWWLLRGNAFRLFRFVLSRVRSWVRSCVFCTLPHHLLRLPRRSRRSWTCERFSRRCLCEDLHAIPSRRSNAMNACLKYDPLRIE